MMGRQKIMLEIESASGIEEKLMVVSADFSHVLRETKTRLYIQYLAWAI